MKIGSDAEPLHLFLVGIGGVFGGIARFQLGKAVSDKSNTAFPLGTFIINITGAFLLGVVSGFHAGESLYILLAEGFLGAYTTFSTLMYEGFDLFLKNKKRNAVVYIASSVLLGIIGYLSGFEIIKIFGL